MSAIQVFMEKLALYSEILIGTSAEEMRHPHKLYQVVLSEKQFNFTEFNHNTNFKFPFLLLTAYPL